MLTVKFYGVEPDGRQTLNIYSCAQVEVTTSEHGAVIDICDKIVKREGVTVNIYKDPLPNKAHITHCYVENYEGKTIHSIRADSFK